MEFLPSVVASLQQQVDTAVERLRNRSAVFDGLADILGPPLESGLGPKATACFLVSHGGVHFLLFVSLGLGFPDEKPEVWVQNIRYGRTLPTMAFLIGVGSGGSSSGRVELGQLAARWSNPRFFFCAIVCGIRHPLQMYSRIAAWVESWNGRCSL